MMLSTVVFLIALAFRLVFPDIYEYKTDEAINVFLASRAYFGHPLPPGSTTSSIGLLNPPLFTYLLAPFTFISRHPAFLTAIIGVANALAIGWFTGQIRKFYPLTITAITGMLLAVLPWSVLFGRKIWTQDLVMPAMLLIIIYTLRIVRDPDRAPWGRLVFASLLALQLYTLSFFVIGTLFGYLLLTARLRIYRAVIVGALAGFLPMVPYIVYILSGGVYRTPALPPGPEPWHAPFMRIGQILSQGGISTLFGTDYVAYVEQLPLLYQSRVVLYAQYLLIPVGLLVVSFTSRYRMLYLSAVIGFSLFLILPIPAHFHYFIPFLPFLCLLSAIALEWVFTTIHKQLGVLLIVVVLTASAAQTAGLLWFVNERGSLAGDYGGTIRTNYHAPNDWQMEEESIVGQIPISSFTGTYPISRMLYSYNDLKFQVARGVADVYSHPYPSFPWYALYTYYTWNTPTPALLKTFRPSQHDPYYQNKRMMYLDIVRLYEESTLTRAAELPGYGVWLSYPSHWRMDASDDATARLITDSTVITLLKTIPNCQGMDCFPDYTRGESYIFEPFVLGKQHGFTCKHQTVWCGTYLPNVGPTRSIGITVISPGEIPLHENTYTTFIKDGVDVILTSMTEY